MTVSHDESSETNRAHWLVDLIDDRSAAILSAWASIQIGNRSTGDGGDFAAHGQAILSALRDAVESSGRVDDPSGPDFEPLRRIITDISVRGARAGATPSETAHGVLALREAFSEVIHSGSTESVGTATGVATTGRLVDALALMTFETYVRGREEVIARQGQQLLELSTPVVQLWDKIIALPLVGTLDSNRAQVVMESLLEAIVDQHALIAILDITGVPTVDTLVAQHLLKTVTATRLMGADCIISGIRPQTAQTIVQLGIDLTDITTRATLADALATAIRRVGDSEPPAGVDGSR